MKDLKGKTFKIEKVDDYLYEWSLWKHGCSLMMDEEEFRDIIDTIAQYVLEGLVDKWKTESISGV